MALILCSECSNQVSDKANSCPNCGAPISGDTTVKKKKSRLGCGIVLVILIVLWGVVNFIGRSGNDDYVERQASSVASGQADIRPQVEVSPAPASLIERISGGLENGFTLRHVHIARSKAHKRAYFVAGELVGPGASGQVGVWVHIGDPEGGGLTYSVNEFAKGFSDWGDGSTTKAAVTMSDPPARELQGFVSKMVDSQGKGD